MKRVCRKWGRLQEKGVLRLRGFTLVELLVAMSILVLLLGAAIFILNPSDYIKRSRDTRRVSDLKIIQTALEQFYGENGRYPSAGEFDVTSSGAFSFGGITYLNNVPQDPDTSREYCYRQKECSGTDAAAEYTLCAQMEGNGSSPCSAACTTTDETKQYCVNNPF